MITCKCGKTLDKIPDWMASITVDFICNNCPNRQAKNLPFVTIEAEPPSISKLAAQRVEGDAHEEPVEDGHAEGAV
ncbi:MAG: hypothetical protein HY248_05325 [Fimbriimonas ginsengisoli]|uniref:Uncharacterized protein n=1 Tax=Fimbriimonas ginsengisoli TaxID=1005039 RepID=A0A931LTU5_FIMGI|nr:hypothetical protein [Fimbriimonas ginsengisoli]MBI3721956.1 hypothetical protein [Fimbriimonas ginsengisoli]